MLNLKLETLCRLDTTYENLTMNWISTGRDIYNPYNDNPHFFRVRVKNDGGEWKKLSMINSMEILDHVCNVYDHVHVSLGISYIGWVVESEFLIKIDNKVEVVSNRIFSQNPTEDFDVFNPCSIVKHLDYSDKVAIIKNSYDFSRYRSALVFSYDGTDNPDKQKELLETLYSNPNINYDILLSPARSLTRRYKHRDVIVFLPVDVSTNARKIFNKIKLITGLEPRMSYINQEWFTTADTREIGHHIFDMFPEKGKERFFFDELQ